MITDSSEVEIGEIRTDFVSFQNRAGMRIAACLDHTGGDLRARPWVLLASKYGETKKSTLHLAYHLAANGLNVLRYDPTNHVGESDGQMLDFTMPGLVGDIVACLDYLETQLGIGRAIGVGNSLSARCLLRVAATDSRLSKAICVAGVVNVISTIQEINQEDLLELRGQGYHWGATNLLGFDVDGDTFLETLLQSRLGDLEGTLEDLRRLTVPVVFFHADRDVWVNRAEVEQVVSANPRARLVTVPAAMHEVRENPRAARQVFEEVVWACRTDEPYPGEARSGLRLPDKKLVFAQNRRERDRMRRSEAPLESEAQFWSNYLRKYSILEKSVDYRAYLDLVGRLCGPLRPGAAVLDAGCGNGLFGLWLLRQAWRRRTGRSGDHPVVYVGLDLTQSGLADALDNHLGWRQGLHGTAKTRAIAPPGLQYFLQDFDELDESGAAAKRLPFRDGTFDVICCSLVLSYLRRPRGLLCELHRVLRPGGVLVVSSMKPNCDLSIIYRDSLATSLTADDFRAGRRLLQAAGQIKLKEEIGYYTFFSQAELAELVLDVGLNVTESHLSLGEQAAVIKAVK